MIYRILVNAISIEWVGNGPNGTLVEKRRLRGPSEDLSDVMWELLLPAPKHEHSHRARYYFTEQGWRQIGLSLAAEARRRGFLVKIICRKNPPKSDIAYKDPLQVALLPRRGKK